MVRWIKLFGDQYLGFWLPGILLFVLQELPYMVMPLVHPANNPIMNMKETSAALDLSEKILGISCVIFMLFVVSKNAVAFEIGSGVRRTGFIVALAVLLLNYAGWVIYFSGHQSIGEMMFFIVTLPPLYYAAIGLWRNNSLLMAAGLAFEAVHFIHVYGNLRGMSA